MNAPSMRRVAFGMNAAAVAALTVLVGVESHSLRATAATGLMGVAFLTSLGTRIGREV